jgi:hypothetical protein
VIKKFLRNIRQKPKAVREQYAFWMASGLTSVVAVVWVTTLINSPFESNETPDEVTVVEPSTLSNFMDVAQNQINTARQEVQNILPTADSATTTTASNSPIVTASSSPVVEVATPQATLRQEIRIATTTSSSTN